MVFQHFSSILYSSDIQKSIRYYTEVLGFDQHWTWDDPPTFGGVNKDVVQIFFCKECQGKPGTWIAIMVDNVDQLHERIRTKGGKVLSEPEDKEWGLREMLVEDPDGHVIRFGQGITPNRKKSGELPEDIKIIERISSVSEYQELTKAVGWNIKGKEQTEMVLRAPLFAAVAEDSKTNNIIGCVLLLGDNASFYYVKDMMVHPDFQSKQIGSALMSKLNEWIERNAPDDVLIGLYTGKNLAPFYRRFGFKESFGMCKRIGRRNE
jgi:catechol 2,3-dioxygenase-like lactoylglutathione lyase family enzyme/GNAT superfamily N-acetyltransferase